MPGFRNIIGERFGRLTVLLLHDRNRHAQIRWQCRCDCGNNHVVTGHGLRTGKVASCGCAKSEATIKAHRVHGHGNNKDRTYLSWLAMKARCNNPRSSKYYMYGAIGVSVWKQWDESFMEFKSYMGERPSGMTLDRFPNREGNYEPGNVRWATPKQQRANQKYISHEQYSRAAHKAWATKRSNGFLPDKDSRGRFVRRTK